MAVSGPLGGAVLLDRLPPDLDALPKDLNDLLVDRFIFQRKEAFPFRLFVAARGIRLHSDTDAGSGGLAYVYQPAVWVPV